MPANVPLPSPNGKLKPRLPRFRSPALMLPRLLGEAPPLFVIGEDGEAQLVNYRVAGRYYVVDRLFGAAELRLGGKKQQIVRISSAQPRRRKGQ